MSKLSWAGMHIDWLYDIYMESKSASDIYGQRILFFSDINSEISGMKKKIINDALRA